MSGELVRYDAMCQAIAAAYEIDEVKDIRDKALALERYAAQANNVEAERQACEIRLRAERKAMQLKRAEGFAKGSDYGGRSNLDGSRVLPSNPPRTLADLGVSKKQSSDWQKLADIPDDQFEAALKSSAKPTTSGIIAAHTPPAEKPRDKVDPRALWLWGRLQDFEREGLLDADPADLIASMLDHMKMTTQELAPRVAAWLGRITT
jgi:hypothetical protein